MSLNLNLLAVVHAVATEQSVSRAADRLLVSQPAVSKQLREIERAVGTPLFERLPRGVRPTEAGRLLADYAKRIADLGVEAEERLAELRGLSRGELRVGASTTIAVYLLPPVFVAFRKAYPGIRLTVTIENATEVEKRLAEGELDVALSEGEPDTETFDAEPFMTDELIAVAPASHALARKKSVSAAAICAERFIVRERGSGTRAVVEHALRDRGLSVTPVMEVGSTIVIKRAVAAGIGVAFVSRLACELELRSGTLVELKTADLKITRPLWRVRIAGRHEGKAVTEFDRLLTEQVKAFGRKRRPPVSNGPDPTAASMG